MFSLKSIHDQLLNNMLDFIKLFYDGQIDQLQEYSDLDLDPYREPKLQSLTDWYEHYKAEDLEVIESHGISMKSLANLKEKFTKLFNLSFLPSYKDWGKSFNLLSIIYYKFHLQAIKIASDEVKASLNSYTGSFKEKLLINHENFQIINFYDSIPVALSELDKLIDNVNDDFAQLNMDRFVFISHFSILKTFLKDIENKDFTPDDINELGYNWCVLFLKGFFLSQIEVQLYENQYTYSEKPLKLTNEEYRIYGNISCRIEFSHLIMDKLEINEAKLNEILNKHENLRYKEILNPFIQVLIPYYKTLTSSAGYLKLIIVKSQEYKKVFKKLNNTPKTIQKAKCEYFSPKYTDDFLMFDEYVYGLYMDKIPFVLNNSPGDTYKRLFDICIKRFNYTCFECENGLIKQPKAPCEELFALDEVPSNLNDLINQKYFIVNSIVKNIIQCSKADKHLLAYVNTNSAALILSLLPWEIDLPSEEARILESKMKENIKLLVKNSPMQNTLYDKMIKFIVKKVWNAKKPLDIELIKSKINL